jgi:hypothetical protein
MHFPLLYLFRARGSLVFPHGTNAVEVPIGFETSVVFTSVVEEGIQHCGGMAESAFVSTEIVGESVLFVVDCQSDSLTLTWLAV